MKHVQKVVSSPDGIVHRFMALCDCGADGDELVLAALESDCEGCRTLCNIGMPAKKPDPKDPYAVRPALAYEPEPLPNADENLAFVVNRRG